MILTYQERKRIIIFLKIILIILIIIYSLKKKCIVSFVLLLLFIILFLYYKYISKIKETTLCLIVKDNQVLMMLRNKKKNDVHINKYNGLGGKLEKGESKETCVLREVYEEAGIVLTDYYYVGKVIFKNFGYKIGTEVMYCFVANDYRNEISECDEGELEWVCKDKILDLPLWDGDKYFIMNIIYNKKFIAFLHYDKDRVIDYKIKYKR